MSPHTQHLPHSVHIFHTAGGSRYSHVIPQELNHIHLTGEEKESRGCLVASFSG